MPGILEVFHKLGGDGLRELNKLREKDERMYRFEVDNNGWFLSSNLKLSLDTDTFIISGVYN